MNPIKEYMIIRGQQDDGGKYLEERIAYYASLGWTVHTVDFKVQQVLFERDTNNQEQTVISQPESNVPEYVFRGKAKTKKIK